jgi:PEP-CTERM motif-containing protein
MIPHNRSKNSLFRPLLVLASAALWASSANALTITINGGESPTFPPTFTMLASGSSPLSLPATPCCGATDSFSVSADVAGTPPLTSGSLLTNTIDINAAAAGTLIIWVTETGLTSPLGEVKFTSGLTSNLFFGAISSVTLSTFVSPTDGVSPPNGSPLDTATFTGLGTETLSTVDNPGAGPYSLQEVFVIKATGAGDTNLTIDLRSSVIPEPSTWAMMLLGFAGLGFLGYRKARMGTLAA